jgi:hypothetical protein
MAVPNNPVSCQIRIAFNPCFFKHAYRFVFTKQEVVILRHIFTAVVDHTLQTAHYAYHAILYIGCNRVGLHHWSVSIN